MNTVTTTNSKSTASAVLFLMLMAAIGSASAQSASFDSSGILADIATYLAAAVGLVGAYIAGKWALRAMGLLRG